MKILKLLLLIILCLLSQKVKPQESYQRLDSISKLEKSKKNYDKAIFFSKKMLKISQTDKERAKALYKLGLYNAEKEKNDSALYYYNQSEKLYKVLKDSTKLMSILGNKANIVHQFGDYNQSDILAIQGVGYDNGKRPNTIASIYNCLAMNSRTQKNDKEAIIYYEKAYNISTNDSHKIIYKGNMANSYRYLKDYKSSIKILEELLKNPKVEKSQTTKARITDNLAYTKWLENPKLNVVDDLLSAKKMREEANDYVGLVASNMHLSDVFKDNNKQKALKYAYKMLDNAKKVNAGEGQIKALDRIILLEYPQNIKKYALRRNFLVDSLQEVKNVEQLKYAKIKFHSEENEKKAKAFKHEASENKLIAEQEKNQKLIIGFGMIISFLAFLFYSWYRKVEHKKDKVVEVYKTETRIAKRIHDELANDVYRVISKVQNSPEKTSEIINDLDSIYNQTRNISHENSTIVTGEKFEEAMRNLLSDFNTSSNKVINKNLSKSNLNELSVEKQIVIYRVVQELLVNSKKHSKASLVVIDFSVKNNNYYITFKDNGIGSTIENKKRGLLNTETRMKSIGGSITFETVIRKGFKASLKFKK